MQKAFGGDASFNSLWCSCLRLFKIDVRYHILECYFLVPWPCRGAPACVI